MEEPLNPNHSLNPWLFPDDPQRTSLCRHTKTAAYFEIYFKEDSIPSFPRLNLQQ